MRTAALFLFVLGCDTSGGAELELEAASYYTCVSQQDEVYNGTMTVQWYGSEPEVATFLYGVLNTVDEHRIAEVDFTTYTPVTLQPDLEFGDLLPFEFEPRADHEADDELIFTVSVGIEDEVFVLETDNVVTLTAQPGLEMCPL